jgi:hypothetical protein
MNQQLKQYIEKLQAEANDDISLVERMAKYQQIYDIIRCQLEAELTKSLSKYTSLRHEFNNDTERKSFDFEINSGVLKKP